MVEQRLRSLSEHATQFTVSANSEHARLLTAGMAGRLATGLRDIVERADGHVDVVRGRSIPLIERIDAGERAAPGIFAIYHDMLRAIEADDLEELQRLFHDLVATDPIVTSMTVRILSRRDFGDRERERYARHAGADQDHPVRFIGTQHRSPAEFSSRFESGLQMLGLCAPSFAEEIDAVIGEIVCAEPDLRDGGRTYGSISAFPLWGAILVNPGVAENDLDCISVLVHELTHTVLFAHSVDEPLVLNRASERFKSPLRDDERPMDGIFHATCVISRMHAALQLCADSGRLDAALREECLTRLNMLAMRGRQGVAVIGAHARLSETGRRISDEVASYFADEC